MKSEWITASVAELEADGTILVQDGNHGEYRPRRHELDPAGTPHIRAADISDSGVIDFDGAQRINDQALARIRKGVGAPGDVILTHKGTVGRVARVPARAPHFVCSPQTTFWRSREPDRLDQGFLFGYLRSPEFAAQLRRRMHESDMAPYVSLTAQRSLLVPLPPIERQRAIAAVLGALDDKIDSNRRLAGLLEETAATLFRARFVDFVGVDEFEDSELGPIPQGWRAQPVGDVLRVVGGSTPSTKQPAFWNGNHCWITPKDLSGAVSPIVLDTARHITDDGVAQISSRLLPSRTVLLSSRAPVGYTAVSFVPIAVNQGFIAIPPTDTVPSEFVYFWLRERMDEIKAHAGGTTFTEISKRAFRPLPMVVPPSVALDAFRGLAEPIFNKMAALEAERRTLAQIHDALLPKLVSGELRVPDTSNPADVIEAMVA